MLAGSAPVWAENARYEVQVHIGWSEQTHPIDWPNGGGHMTGMIGATHHGRYILFRDGRTATTGLKVVAENGRVAIMRAEMAEAARRGRVGEVFDSKGVGMVPGQMATTFNATPEHSMVSMSSMIAPSPDWFTGVDSVQLMQNGAWVDTITQPLWAWDAGTDSGTDYTAKNAETQPAQSIRLLYHRSFFSSEGLTPIGYAVFTRVAD